MKVPKGYKENNWTSPAIMDENGKLHLGRFVGTVKRYYTVHDMWYGYDVELVTNTAYPDIK